MKYAQNITELVGNTPLVKLINASSHALVLGKCEFMNPTHSVKDRIGNSMINDALKKGLINKNTTVIEATSGNTGIALASICAVHGIKLVLTMPSSMSIERKRLLKALGADLILTNPEQGMEGAVYKAVELANETENSFILEQFENSANPEVHRLTTAKEILADTNGNIDILVAAIGTGGSITGISEVLKAHNPNIKIIAVEPKSSPVLSGGRPGPHNIQGIGAGFIPKVLNTEIYDEVIQVSNEDAIETSRALAKREGLLVGISSGANTFVASQLAHKEENQGKVIVTILCDTGERYLCAGLYDVDDE
ncbi:cysteine synthase A [Sulfurovum sp. XGS-02]|uniref:cysteine synthase A n=1 Tax=Sulfurovum sp. XGS-02 TaxID=2925411 RepID=UPI002059CBF2|nr:cysteine synthase A [Sulfurovum sp. XGS-02]UPT77889.1 cysteine synthase A [Sulfurovum sp. XGS-02]